MTYPLRHCAIVYDSELVGSFNLLVVNEREEGVAALHLPLKQKAALGWTWYRDENPVPRGPLRDRDWLCYCIRY